MREGAKERAEAKAWLRRHRNDPSVAGASLPSDHHRSETGETLDHEQSGYLTAGRGGWTGTSDARRSSEGHRGVLSYSRLTELQDRPGVLIGRGQRSRIEMDKRVRVDRAMASLRKDQQELLRMRYAERMTHGEIAGEMGVDESAVRRKLRVAIQDLYVHIAASWNLPYDLTDEVFGVKREGRPARDRDGERRAAELAVEGFFADARSAEEDE